MAERIRARGEGGAGGWLESACKGILTFRAGILLITVVALWGQDGDGDTLVPAAAILVAAVTTVRSRCATGTASARRWSATPATWRPSSCSRR